MSICRESDSMPEHRTKIAFRVKWEQNSQSKNAKSCLYKLTYWY